MASLPFPCPDTHLEGAARQQSMSGPSSFSTRQQSRSSSSEPSTSRRQNSRFSAAIFISPQDVVDGTQLIHKQRANNNNTKHACCQEKKTQSSPDCPNSTSDDNLGVMGTTYPEFLRSHLELFFTLNPGKHGSNVFENLNLAWEFHKREFGDNCGESCVCLGRDARVKILKHAVAK